MHNSLILAALVSSGLAQDQDDDWPHIVDIRIPAIDIQIPEIDVGEFQVQVPAIDIVIPAFDLWGEGWSVQIPEIEVDVQEIAVDVPRIVIPAMRFDWHGHDLEAYFDWRGRDRDHEWTEIFEFDTDTTFDVDPNSRLEIRNHAGEVVVRTWSRNAVRVQAQHDDSDKVKVYKSDDVVRIRSESRYGPPDIVDYELTVPASMALDIWGVYTDVSIGGVRAGTRVETIHGDIGVSDVSGEISLRSVEGSVSVRNVEGRLELNTVEQEIIVERARGTVYAETIDGDIQLVDLDSDNVDAKTVDGDIDYGGTIKSTGRYRLTTHDGTIVVAVPRDANATVAVATFDGVFETDFPVQIVRAEGSRRFSFKLGDGSARLELHAFDGSIQLVRK